MMKRGLFPAACGVAIAMLALVPAAEGAVWGVPYNVPAPSGSIERVSDLSTTSRIAIPDLIFTDASNVPVHLSRYKGSVVVVNFYSQNCGPCMKDLLYINRLQGNFPKEPLVVLAVDEDNVQPRTLLPFLRHQNLGFLRPFSDPSNISANALGVKGLPSSIVVDKAGKLVAAVQGNVVWDSPAVQTEIGRLLRE